jgi:light-regulated signal transduction histidine kinase (bacteriophytochrome)
VLALARTATAVAEQRNYSARADRFGDDELGRLTDVFNEMLERIQEQDAALRTREDRLRQEVIDRTRAEAEVLTLNGTLERRVHDRTQALEEANRELEAFSYTVSHDLRAPLRHIHGYGEMLRRATADGGLSDKAQRYLDTMIGASVEMGVLIDDLLAFSRMGRTELRTTEVSMSNLVAETILGLEMATRNRPIEWQIEALPPAVGDRAMIKQVLANLIGNAVKYTRMREPARIDIGCAGQENGRMIVFVRDNGAGFDPQYAHKLFGVFQRLHRAEEFDGSGIGLATVMRITTRHGGRAWAEGAIDQGATFYFTIQNAIPVAAPQ